MIVGYRDKHTERFAAGGFVKRFQSFEQQAIKRLTILNAAPSLETLGALPRQSVGSPRWRSERAVFHLHQPAMADLFRVAKQSTRAEQRRDSGLSLMKGALHVLKRSIHPGQILRDELKEFGITPTEFARQIDVPPNRVSQIINAKRSITGDTALRFGHWFGVDRNSGLTCKRISILSLPMRKRRHDPPSADKGKPAAPNRTADCAIG